MGQYLNESAPRTPNFNPAADVQEASKSGWVQYLEAMNSSAIAFADFVFQSRLQALAGIDEMVEDVVGHLEAKGVLDNTYVVYTSDNGYHLGQHRVPGGKSLFYNEDTNIPFVVRGPDVPAGVSSGIPSLHLDLAPTFLAIAGLPEDRWPVFLDGQSLLGQWHRPGARNLSADAGRGNSKESLNVEYWGLVGIEAPSGPQLGGSYTNNTYKTIRVVGTEQNWAYAVWCNGQTELYNITADPYELTNLARGGGGGGGGAAFAEHQRVAHRLNALLMVTKSCEQDRCRDPWAQLAPPAANGTTLTSLAAAMDAAYDGYFAGFEKVAFDTCVAYQDADNEAPFFPPLDTLAGGGLGRAYRNATDDIAASPGYRVITTPEYFGTEDQRNATWSDLQAVARRLTESEISRTING